MKKFLTIMLVAITAVMLSSCVIVTTDTPHTNYYQLTCHNMTNYQISDWCVVKDGNVTYAKDKNNFCPISANGGSATMNLPEGKYVVYVSFYQNPDYDDGDYTKTLEFTLDEDSDIYIDKTYVPNNL